MAAFRPWDTSAAASTTPPPLKDILARVATERGHFRAITESALIAEIEAPSSPSSSASSSSDDDDNDSLENEVSQPKSLPELYAAKNDILTNIASAQQEIAMALELVSLLSTAQIPAAATTVSPFLKAQGIPMGSLGVDFWNRMPENQASVAEEARLAKVVRMSQLRESAEDLMAAAERLEGNVRREKVFWAEIVGISESGWSVSRIPKTQGLLGVHFGFNGAEREFSERDLAALVAGEEDGGVVLARGVGTKLKALRVVVRREGTLVGCSRVPAVFDTGSTGLEKRISAARDSLFDEELWHEMVREGRALLSLGVGMKGNTLYFPADEHKTVQLELISLDEEDPLPENSLHGSDDLAQAILLAARLLLSHSHRETLRLKSLPPPPMSEKKDPEKPVLPLLRPILRILSHYNDITSLNGYLETLETVLGNADIETASHHASFSLPIPAAAEEERGLDVATLITTLLRPLRSTATLSIPGDTPFELITTLLTDALTETYTLSLGPSTYHLPTLPDLFAAVDEFVAVELVSRLHSAAPVSGAEWELDRREGVLMREVGERREGFCCVVKGEEARLILRREPKGKRDVMWGLDKVGEVGSLWEEWGRMIEEGT